MMIMATLILALLKEKKHPLNPKKKDGKGS
jgi:hypothetical protein